MPPTTKQQAAPTDRREDTRWLVRSVSLPVQECLSCDWPTFLRTLHGAWRQSTDLANWASHTLARLDVVRTPDMKELPPLSKVDLYALAFGREKERMGKQHYRCCECARKFTHNGQAPDHKRGKTDCAGSGRPTVALDRVTLPPVAGEFGGSGWEGAKIAAASLLRWVEAKYRKERGKVVWRRERRTPEFLYPVPFPVHQQAWEVFFDERGRPVVIVQLPGGRVSLRLRNGPEFAHAVEVLRKIEAGDVAKMELKICRQRAYSQHYRKDTDRPAATGRKDSYRVMIRVSYRTEAAAVTDGVLAELKTGSAPFLRLSVAGLHESHWHCRHAVTWIVRHRRFLDRLADDTKYEKRWPRKKRRRLNARYDRVCGKHANRMKSFLQETAAQVVNHCVRNNVGVLSYDDADRSFVSEFPWFLLKERLRQKCDESGIVFRTASGDAADGAGEEDVAEADCRGDVASISANLASREE